MRTTKSTNYNDLRVRKTEKAIRSAFCQLLKEKAANKITIRELTERAEINKSTFYAHYDTIQDLIAALEQESIQYILSNLENFHLLFQNPDQFIDHLYKTLYDGQLDIISRTNSGDGHFTAQISSALKEEMEQQNIDVDQYHQMGALIAFILDGLLGLIQNHSKTRLIDLEYIKTFVRGGIHEIQNSIE